MSRRGILRRQSLKLCKSRHYFEAISILDKLLKIRKRDAMSWFDRGLLLSETEQYTEAIKSYDKAIGCGGVLNFNFHSKVWYSKALALYKIENYHEALITFDLALKIPFFDFSLLGRSFFYRIWYHQGLTLHKLKKYNAALNNYDLALKQRFYPLWCGLDKLVFHFRTYEKILAQHNASLKQKPDNNSIL